MLSRSFKLSAAFVIGFWIIILIYLFGLKREEIIKSEVDISKLGNISGLASGNIEYLGVYFADRKIGYLLNRTEKLGEKILIHHRSELNLSVQGSNRNVNIEGSAELDENMFLNSFYFRLVTEKQELVITGKSENKRLVVKSNLEGFREIELDNSNPIFLDVGINRYIAKKLHSHTKRFGFRIFSLEGFNTETVDVEVLGHKRVNILGEEVFANHVRKRYKSFVVDSYIDFNGKTLMEKSELGFTLIRENPDNLNSKYSSLDLITNFSILPDKSIPDIFSLTELRVKLSGIESIEGLIGGRQDYTNGLLVIKSERVNKFSEEISSEEKERLTAAEPFIQSTHPDIISLAKKVTEGSKTTLDALEKVNDYLFYNVKKENIIGIPDAITTLRNMEGDCNEHVMLFVALARSLGIAVRPVGGVAYLNGRFYFHAWVEAYVDGWRTYDPTWGQSPADVGHIRLVSGGMDKILDIAKYINKLKIEVMEWR
ncbi:MAG: transglutaminase-like domain-containing protein [Deltaproteobacteria bacterium]|nr:transglutaminase-like domain-containing protein [Deltaproteobacteria bacterium]